MSPFVSPDEIRTRFSQAMSLMYRDEVPQYGTLLSLVADVNAETLEQDPALAARLERAGEIERLGVERHGAIRLGTARELSTMRRLFAVMGMVPVGYYDLSVAGVPVHSTAFRPVSDAALAKNPFRVFTSLLRLDLVSDAALRETAAAILARRRIYTPDALALIDRAEAQGGLADGEADRFVAEALHTFRWHGEATVDAATYEALSAAHRLVADVVCFKGPHINHLTPRTLDIDAAQGEMPRRGIAAKAVVEGPPPRAVPILLRQTSFKALEEPIRFPGGTGAVSGTHTARFGEIEQRGLALTPKGRALYDALLARARDGEETEGPYETRLARAFADLPDDEASLRRQGLGYFRYTLLDAGKARPGAALEDLVAAGAVGADPIVYEDFLPVSAAGIFQSNLGGAEQASYAANAARDAFEADLGAGVLDEFALYAAAERASIERVEAALGASFRTASAA
ncbi:VOC family protein [Aurantimonas sp. Leaf443]|uniref:2-oxoadipate dioxygenase/decarboxylase HglS n=1 Tax=Aurantimonas sp. Leaf443 TaxID=1736378 RepID=UPI0006FBCC77|nr:VOC family protein [Aurantimonas sp. Leaf443]KQT85291.1 hypothetical protein ASG48_08525 [Aurantimonas sp. Leaf443]